MRHIANLQVKNIMRNFKTVKETAKISEVIKTFNSSKTDAVAVVNSKGKFVGDIHQHDLLKLLIDPKDISWDEVTGVFGRIVDMGYFAETAKDLMHRHELTVTPETSVREVVSLMFKHNIDALPVLKGEKIVGMITEMELLNKILKGGKK
jgi:acetoin utilization protein AcuB